MQQPPVLPEILVARVVRLGHAHGTCVLYVAGGFALISALIGDYVGAVTGLLVAGAGAIEQHGAALLRQREARGISWLVASQLFLFVAIAAYCALQLYRFSPPPLPGLLRPLLEAPALQFALSEEALFALLCRLVLWVVLFGSVFYQGGLAFYYFRRRVAVSRWLEPE